MHNNKSFYITMIPIIISVIIGVLLLVFHNSFGTDSKAALAVAKERSEMSSSISDLNAEKEDLNAQISEYETTINNNSEILSEIEGLQAELENSDQNLESAKARTEELQKELDEKQAYADSIDSVETTKDGDTKQLKAGEYECPDDIKAGRYRAEGSGNIVIKKTGTDISRDLDTIDTNSYEFELESGDSLTIDGEITLTELIAE